MSNSIKKVVVVGGGLSGWIAAAGLAKFLKHRDVQVAVVAPYDDGSLQRAISVGPVIKNFLAFLGVTEEELLKRCKGTFRLGTQFEDWSPNSEHFFAPYGLYGAPIERADFLSCWLRMRSLGQAGPLADYCIPRVLAKHSKFARPAGNTEGPSSAVSQFDFGYHLDKSAFVDMLKDIALDLGVEYTGFSVDSANLDDASGQIKSVSLSNGDEVGGDLFVDCSGDEAVLIGKTYASEIEDWGAQVPSTAIAITSVAEEDFEPYTTVRGANAGWIKIDPLQGRKQISYYYNRDLVEDKDILAELKSIFGKKKIETTTVITTENGARKKAWIKNCVALGAAAGGVDDIVSSRSLSVFSNLSRFFSLFPANAVNEAEAEEYNRQNFEECSRLRDFVMLQLWGRKSGGSEYWKRCTDANMSPELAHKISVFTQKGVLPKYECDTFGDATWISVFEGLGMLPESFDLRAEEHETEKLKAIFDQIKGSIAKVVADAPAHESFVTHAAFRSKI